MAKTKISEFSATPGNNTDIDGINIAEGCAPSGINDAIRELMSQLKDFQTGAAGDSFNGPVGTTTAAAGAFTTLTTSSTVTHNGGTANGVAYLNGSKVLTTGNALTFDGTNLGVVGNGKATSALAVGDSSGNWSGSMVNESDASKSVTFNADSANVGANSFMRWNVDGSEQMRLTSTGLGIGTSSPGAKLHVTSGAAGVQALFSYGTGTPTIAVGNSTTNYNLQVGYNVNSEYGYIQATAATGVGDDIVINPNGGNLGLGVTPSAWGGGYKAIEVYYGALANTGSGSVDVAVTQNAFFNGTNWITKYTGQSKRQVLSDAGFVWHLGASQTAGNAITFTQAMTLDASGNLLVGATTNYSSARILAYTSDATANVFVGLQDSGTTTQTIRLGAYTSGSSAVWGTSISALTNYASTLATQLSFSTTDSGGTLSERARIDSSGNLYCVGVYNATSGSGANVGVNSAGLFYRSTSSLKYKKDVQDATYGLAEVLQLRPVTYKSKAKADGDKVFGGLIAEEVHEAGLTEFVQYAEDGTPDALAYGNMVSLCIKAIQELNAQQAALNAKLESQAAEIAALKSSN